MIRTLISNIHRTGRLFSALAIGATLLSAQDFKASKVEIDLGVGGAGFHRRPDPLRTKLTNSGLLGFRVTQNLWNHWSLEQSYMSTIGADLLLSRAPNVNFQRQDFNQRTNTFMFNPVYHLTENGSRIRPFFTMGLGMISYSPTKDAKEVGANLRPFPAANLDTSTKFGVNYGGGVKARLTDLISLRFDIRGLTSGAPTFGLPASGPAGSFFIPNTGRAHSIQTSGGIGFNFGGDRSSRDSGGGGSSSISSRTFRLDPIAANPPGPIKIGTPSILTTRLTDSKNSNKTVWEWTVNGVPQPGAKGPEFRFDPATPGTYVIKVTATDGKMSASESYTIVVEDPTKREFKLTPITSRPSNSIFAGESADLATVLNDSAKSPTTVYEWTVNGVKQPGANGPTFKFTPPGPGTYTITVTATDGNLTSTETITIVVKEAPPLTITSAVDKNELKAGETARVTAQGSQSDYSGKLTYTWKASDGSVSGGGSTGSGAFDSNQVQFDPAGQFRQQNKTITLTASVSDERGRTATAAPLTIRVTRDPQVMRLDDVIFGNGSSRVNNCGKRILIDELAAILNNNPEVEVLLIGHHDAAEGGTRRLKNGKRVAAATAVDRERVLNVAAVISAGKGICGNCALSRIRVDWVGTDQTSEHRAGFCGTSSRNKSEERKSDEIAADDAAAKNRRVEIWIVPKGMAMPSAAKAPKPAPVKAIQLRGCPR
jgi:outer membrane protein OmpA-like peptidoglycan-associated protein/opacity protein-like surface antigen